MLFFEEIFIKINISFNFVFIFLQNTLQFPSPHRSRMQFEPQHCRFFVKIQSILFVRVEFSTDWHRAFHFLEFFVAISFPKIKFRHFSKKYIIRKSFRNTDFFVSRTNFYSNEPTDANFISDMCKTIIFGVEPIFECFTFRIFRI